MLKKLLLFFFIAPISMSTFTANHLKDSVFATVEEVNNKVCTVVDNFSDILFVAITKEEKKLDTFLEAIEGLIDIFANLSTEKKVQLMLLLKRKPELFDNLKDTLSNKFEQNKEWQDLIEKPSPTQDIIFYRIERIFEKIGLLGGEVKFNFPL